MIRAVRIAALACAAVIAATSPAAAAVTIGQVAAPSKVAANCAGSATDLLQPSVTEGAQLYVARQAGIITSWSTRALAGPGQSYTLKVFRRTTDPDVFRVLAHSGPHTVAIGGGLQTFPASVPVSSGDLVGLNANGAPNACIFDVPGDTVLERAGSLADDATGTFVPRPDSRLNLSAVLMPTNAFTFGDLFRDRGNGTATLEIHLPNPGEVSLTGKGLKAKPATKVVAVASTVRFGIAAAGGKRKKLNRTGKVSVRVAATFTPTGGDPATQARNVRLKQKR